MYSVDTEEIRQTISKWEPDIRTRSMDDAALVCSVQKWDTVNKGGSTNPSFMMRQTDYLEKQDGDWKVLHEHTSMSESWDGTIVE